MLSSVPCYAGGAGPWPANAGRSRTCPAIWVRFASAKWGPLHNPGGRECGSQPSTLTPPRTPCYHPARTRSPEPFVEGPRRQRSCAPPQVCGPIVQRPRTPALQAGNGDSNSPGATKAPDPLDRCGSTGEASVSCGSRPVRIFGAVAWAHGSAGERLLHTQEVGGSNPPAPTKLDTGD